jgi:hypothetical protein
MTDTIAPAAGPTVNEQGDALDDQLLALATDDDLLARDGFTGQGAATITPMHAITWGRRPAS